MNNEIDLTYKVDLNVAKPMVEFRKYKLQNGLTVILSKNQKIPNVVINTTYKVGSKNEDPDKTGLAHLLEHLLFEETANTGKGQFDILLQERGGDSNAYTSNDVTNYYMILPSNQLEFGLWLDSDRMVGFGVSEKSLEIQKKVVHEEKLLYCDNAPFGSVDELSSKLLFPDCAYRWTVIGDTKNLMEIKLSEVKNFYDRFYNPENSVLTIVGDIEYSSTLEMVHKYYGGITNNGNLTLTDFGVISDLSEQQKFVKDNIQLPSDFLFYVVPEKNSKEYFTGNLLSYILSSGDSSLLYNELVYRDDLISDVEVNCQSLDKAGVYSISFSGYHTKPLDNAIKKYDEIIEKISNGDLEEREIEKAKNQVLTLYCKNSDMMILTADLLANSEIFFGDPEVINSSIYQYLGVTKEDLVTYVRNYMQPQKRLRLSYIPKNNNHNWKNS